MYALLSGLWKYLFQKEEYYVLILGLDDAGKTTYLEQSKTQFNKNKGMNLSKITSTVGLNIGKIDIGSTRLNFWDLGGQEDLQALWDKYYAESHALIYVIDSNDRERVEESKVAFEKMITSDVLDGVPLLILANKQDLEGHMTVSDIKTQFRDSAHHIGRRDCKVLGTAAITGEGVHEGIDWITQAVQRNNIRRPPAQKEIGT
ncbi:ADP-ribosylation factor-related protein 1-like [Lineus longissimus]|uniref:ADP-ribosylation factor-related protein 1-like n=1 Tax=Lineus longissimus TaxID=88925 RepID=UPI002B4C286E